MNSSDFCAGQRAGPGRGGGGAGFRARWPGRASRPWPAPLPPPRQAVLRRLAYRGAEIDQALLLWFPAPAQLHRRGCGGIPYPWRPGGARSLVCRAFRSWALRPAEPGEFSRRAVENGKLDLTRAEAIADLVDAETPAQLRQALRQHDGALADLYEGWRAAPDRGAGPGRGGDRFFRRWRGRGGVRRRPARGCRKYRRKYKDIWTMPGGAKACARACG